MHLCRIGHGSSIIVSVHAHGICHVLSRRSVVCMSHGSEYKCHQKTHLTFSNWLGPSHYFILCIDSSEVYGGWRRGKWQLHFLFQLFGVSSNSSSCVSCWLLNWCCDLHLACFVISRDSVAWDKVHLNSASFHSKAWRKVEITYNGKIYLIFNAHISTCVNLAWQDFRVSILNKI